jgi:hypothetical protein
MRRYDAAPLAPTSPQRGEVARALARAGEGDMEYFKNRTRRLRSAQTLKGAFGKLCETAGSHNGSFASIQSIDMSSIS